MGACDYLAAAELTGRPALDRALRPAWARVDLDALEANADLLARAVAPARWAAVVKADAYGHGAAAVGRALAARGASLLAVALVEEGAELRRAGIETPVLVLGTVEAAQLAEVRRYRLTPTLSTPEEIALWREATAGEAAPVAVHFQADTGMSRLGVPPEEVAEALAAVRAAPGLELAGFMSHLGDAEDAESPRNPEQERRFAALLELLTPEERGRVAVHLANSAAGLHRPADRRDLVRFGLALYGYDPAGRESGGALGLRPAMSVAARVAQVREVPAGRAAGYGSRWIARRPSRLATVPVGYADGYPWRLTNRAEALAGGRRVPVAGAVSMDLTILDVTELGAGEVRVGSEVALLGRQGGESIDAWELAEKADTIPYEILTVFGLRLPRVHLRGGQIESAASRLLGGRVPEPGR